MSISARSNRDNVYWDRPDSRRIVQEAGLNPAFISFKDSAINNWHFILDYARQDAASVDSIIDVAIGEQPQAKKEVLLKAKLHALNLRGTDYNGRQKLDREKAEVKVQYRPCANSTQPSSRLR